MVFGKRGRMIDIRELQKRGVVRIPKEEIKVPQGSVDMVNAQDLISEPTSPASNTDSRRQNERITELDNKIYRLENRLEVLEKKLDVNQPSEPTGNLIGW